ncbi:MAG: 3-phosphoglycerate dehydrogenase [Clostridiales bacterium]|nr:3-phosphoglycerate dehydrogenase [Clostridiales bacterium]
MYQILKLNKISAVIDNVFGENYNVNDDAQNPDGIILRSFNMANYKTGDKLLAVARAGAGVNNIPVPEMTEKGIVVFNTPGANANAVKELVICAMLLASRDIVGGINWANTLTDDVEKATEKGKRAFGGSEILGKTVGVIGLGAIGALVANACVALGMKVIGYDKFLCEQSKAKLDSAVQIVTLEQIYKNSDIITMHVPLCDSTKKMINKDTLAQMKEGVILINMSRGALVDTDELKVAIDSGKVGKYVVDFPSKDILNCRNIIAVPHLGASTKEAEDNCAVMASSQLVDYLENGNILNSVNFPEINKEWNAKHRTVILFKQGCNILDQVDGDIKIAQNKGLGVAIIDTDSLLDLPLCDGVLRIRHLEK